MDSGHPSVTPLKIEMFHLLVSFKSSITILSALGMSLYNIIVYCFVLYLNRRMSMARAKHPGKHIETELSLTLCE